MPASESDIKHQKSAVHNAADTGATGGSISSPRVQVSEATSGEVLPKLKAKSSGTVDDAGDIETQYQVSYVENEAADAVTSFVLYLENVLRTLSGNVALDIKPLSASENSTKSLVLWGVDNLNALVTETVALNVMPTGGVRRLV
ncbi:MAG TPA: hypothetical protein EYO33_24060, partial [Phycisphaerales bacterium]|nr:hypothetical protein [Phycisphaerales bacterium]